IGLHVVDVDLPLAPGVRPAVATTTDVNAAALAVVTGTEVDPRRLAVPGGRGRPPVRGRVVQVRAFAEAPEQLPRGQVDEQAAVPGGGARRGRLPALPLPRRRVVEPRAGVGGVELLAVLLQEREPLRHGPPPVVAAGGYARELPGVRVVG